VPNNVPQFVIRDYIFFLILTQSNKVLYNYGSTLNVILFKIFTIILLYYVTGNITQGCNRF
jgi:hypothetical protein